MTANKTAKIQFYEGTDEPVVPEIRLTRSKDGTTGQALFLFEKPQALSSITDGEITGMRMIDSEGEILTREVKVKFVDGEPIFLEAVYIWKNTPDFDRFMRFANSYAKSNGLGYSEKKQNIMKIEQFIIFQVSSNINHFINSMDFKGFSPTNNLFFSNFKYCM